jgi:protein-tyrosine phosphatase
LDRPGTIGALVRMGTAADVIDLHTHILHGVDDGATSVDESLAMARGALADGVRVVAATPHVHEGSELDAAGIERAVAALREKLQDDGLELAVLTGAEVSIDTALALPAAELDALGLAGNPRYLLLETPYAGWRLDLADVVAELVEGGRQPVLAHPERNVAVQQRPDLLDGLVAGGALVQLTAQSLTGRFGASPKRTARALLERGTAHIVASDAHNAAHRPIELSSVFARLDEPLARWLTSDVPQAIVAGAELPAPPRRRSAWRRGRVPLRRHA